MQIQTRTPSAVRRVLPGCVAAASIATIAQAAPVAHQAQQREGFRPVAHNIWDIDPISGANNPQPFHRERGMLDERVAPPPHPPLDEIPPMPMPMPGDQTPRGIAPADNSSTFHDAQTGETFRLPVEAPSGRQSGQSVEGDFYGVVPYEDDLVSPAGFGTMTIPSGLDSFPRSPNVKLAMRFTDTSGNQRWFVCSGSMNDAGVVLTAAHCIYNRDSDIDDWADIVYVYPAWDGNGNIITPGNEEVIENFGYATGTVFLAGTDYVNNGNRDRDVGAIRLTRGTSRNVGMLTGWYAWAWGFGCSTIQSRTYYNFSYPAENCPLSGLHNGRDMYFWSGSVDACPDNQMQLSTGGGNCFDTVWGGMSGSGMYYIDGDSRFVHSVASTSDRNVVGNYAKLWEQFTIDLVDFENNTRTNSEDWEALNMRSEGSTVATAGQAMNDEFDVALVNATNANPPSRNYNIDVYLSTNNNISTFDTNLATWNYSGDWGAMANVNHNIPEPVIPYDTPSGDYWIGVIADSNLPGTIGNDDTDTWDAEPITVNGVADMTPASVTSDSFGFRGENVDVSFDLDNLGGDASNSVTVEVRISTNDIISTFDTLVDTRFYSGVSGSGSISDTVNVTLPTGVSDGDYYMGVLISHSDDNNTGNNSLAASSEITVDSRADLAAQTIQAASPTYTLGGDMTYDITITNNGLGDSGPVDADIRLSTNDFISTSDTQVTTVSVPSIAPGATWSDTITSPVPSISSGDYYLGMIVDSGDNENNTGDNSTFDPTQVTIAACTGDLNGDGVIDFSDVNIFVAAFQSSDPVADLSGNGSVGFEDVNLFTSAFAAGCP